MLRVLKFHSVDSGFCRVYYRRHFDDGRRPTLYCLQDDGQQGIKPYLCTPDGEPEYEIAAAFYQIEKCPGDSKLEKQINEFIDTLQPKGSL